jgi:hypothetical protein
LLIVIELIYTQVWNDNVLRQEEKNLEFMLIYTKLTKFYEGVNNIKTKLGLQRLVLYTYVKE